MRYLSTLAVCTHLCACLEGDPNPYESTSPQGSVDVATGIQPSQKCSERSDTPFTLSLTNAYKDVVLDVYWVTPQCNEMFYARLLPGQTFNTSTFLTHPWRARHASTQVLLFEYIPSVGSSAMLSIP